MSKKEIVVIVSRALSMYCLLWVFAELTYVPIRVYDVLYHLGPQTLTTAYFRDTYVLELVFLFVRIAVLSVIAIWLYRCSPRIQAFFMPEADVENNND